MFLSIKNVVILDINHRKMHNNAKERSVRSDRVVDLVQAIEQLPKGVHDPPLLTSLLNSLDLLQLGSSHTQKGCLQWISAGEELPGFTNSHS